MTAMRAWIVLVAACSFPTKHTGTTSDGPPAGDGSAQSDGMRMPDGAADGVQALVKRVFVSSVALFPSLNGTAGADAQCAGLAQQANLGGTWLAWVSAPQFPAFARMTHATMPYTLVDKQTIVAQSWLDFTDGSLAHAIDHDEHFLTPSAAGFNCPDTNCTSVWTGTDQAGNFIAPDCQDWTQNTPTNSGTTGFWPATGIAWTNGNQPAPCSFEARIYCIEQ